MAKLVYPFQRVYPITQKFGNPSAQYASGKHGGVDFGAPAGTDILASKGKVKFAGWNKVGYGNLVILEHELGLLYYGHMLKTPHIEKDETVEDGQVIGFVGSTGNSTGNHLHWELRLGGKTQVDPLEYIDEEIPEALPPAVNYPKVDSNILIGDYVRVNSRYDYVNIRPQPSTAAHVPDLGDLSPKAKVEVVEIRGDWLGVKLWIHGGYVERAE
jgi:hypothetical protein